MGADVYDFRTGKLCKCCSTCGFWKELSDFPLIEMGKYGVGDVCHSCIASHEQVDFIFEMGEEGGFDDEVA